MKVEAVGGACVSDDFSCPDFIPDARPDFGSNGPASDACTLDIADADDSEAYAETDHATPERGTDGDKPYTSSDLCAV